MKIFPPFGIDLGTTRTAAAIFLPDSEAPVVAPCEGDAVTMPSVLRSLSAGRWTVGDDALEQVSGSGPLVESVKRWMGESEPLPGADDLHPDEASAVILSSITHRMQAYLDDCYPDLEVVARDAVITVPAYFDAPQIEATRRAGELAGLNVVALIQEPTAAAIYHTWQREIGDGTFLIYDLGGGTFDVSIIEALYGEYQVLTIDGDNHLGGDDFDRRLAELMRSHIIEDGFHLGESVENPIDFNAFQILRRIARGVKEELSESQEVTVDEEQIFFDRDDRAVHLQITIDRQSFEHAIAELVEGTMVSCRRALKQARDRHGLEPGDVDGVFLVGGSTRVPLIGEKLWETFGESMDLGRDQIINDDPDTSVARGAALHAAAVAPLRFEDSDKEVTISITDLPGDNPDRRLIGHLEATEELSATSICFQHSPDDAFLRAPLEPGEEARFSIDDFRPAELNPANLPIIVTRLCDGDDALWGPAHLWIPERPEGAKQAPALTLSNPAVLAKEITVEIVDDGRPGRKVLLPRGCHLPSTARHRLVTGDRSGSLVLRLFQHRLPIHTIVLPLPDDTPPGTPVELVVDVDQAMNLTASGSVDNQTFWARIDRPTAPRRRQWEEIEELMDRAELIGHRLWGVEGRRFQEEKHYLEAGILAALRHDPHRLQVLARRLAALVEDFAPRPERTPGRRRVDSLVDSIRRVVMSSSEDRLGRSQREWSQSLSALRDEVEEAWRGDDDARWQELADRIQATYESVAQDEYLFRRRDAHRHTQTLYSVTSGRLTQLLERIHQFPFAADDDVRALQRRELTSIEGAASDLQQRLNRGKPGPERIPEFERTARSVDHLERRLQQVHILGVPRRGESP